MADIVVVFHSGYGHTQRVAQSVADGADAQLLQIDADGNLPGGGWELLAAADAIIMGSPTYMGGVSWQFKKFADASSKVWFVHGWRGKLFAGFTNSSGMNGDKDATLTYLWHFASQHGGLWVPLGIPPSHDKAARRDSHCWTREAEYGAVEPVVEEARGEPQCHERGHPRRLAQRDGERTEEALSVIHAT